MGNSGCARYSRDRRRLYNKNQPAIVNHLRNKNRLILSTCQSSGNERLR